MTCVCKRKENIICSDVFKCTESNPILQAIHRTEMHGTVLSASATLSAVRRNGLSEMVMWVVGWNNCCLLWGLYRARKYNLWSESRHGECSVHIVTTVLQTVNPSYPQLTKPSHSAVSSLHALRAKSIAVWPKSSFILTSATLSTSRFATNVAPAPHYAAESLFSLVHRIQLRSSVQQQTAHIQVSVIGCSMQKGRPKH